jgi:hypothetical protein
MMGNKRCRTVSIETANYDRDEDVNGIDSLLSSTSTVPGATHCRCRRPSAGCTTTWPTGDDDGRHYTYDVDAWGRVRKVNNRLTPFALVAEYTYNGLGYRIGWTYDADVDGAADDPYWF